MSFLYISYWTEKLSVTSTLWHCCFAFFPKFFEGPNLHQRTKFRLCWSQQSPLKPYRFHLEMELVELFEKKNQKKYFAKENLLVRIFFSVSYSKPTLHVLPYGNCRDLLPWSPSFLLDWNFLNGGSSSLIESNDSKEAFSVADWNSIWILPRGFDILDKISVLAIS